jgi:hypothetical protein
MASINVRAHIIASSKDISLSTTNGVGRSVNLKGIIVADACGEPTTSSRAASESGTMNPGLENVSKLALEKACFLDYEDA